MPYIQAKESLNNPEATLEELLRALFDLGKEWGYIACSAGYGSRENAESDLIRIIVLNDMIICRIQQHIEIKI